MFYSKLTTITNCIKYIAERLHKRIFERAVTIKRKALNIKKTGEHASECRIYQKIGLAPNTSTLKLSEKSECSLNLPIRHVFKLYCNGHLKIKQWQTSIKLWIFCTTLNLLRYMIKCQVKWYVFNIVQTWFKSQIFVIESSPVLWCL